MKAEIIGCYQEDPLTFVGMCAGVSTNKMDKGDLVKRAKRCFDEGHLSVFEHLKLTWVISDVSRALTHQLVRHRHCSFTQESQRYTETDITSDWYIEPDNTNIPEDVLDTYHEAMLNLGNLYKLLLDTGMPKEDARLVLPNGAKTKIVCTMNMAEFFHFFRLRHDPAAQWEIRNLADLMLESIKDLGGEWVELANMFYKKASVF